MARRACTGRSFFQRRPWWGEHCQDGPVAFAFEGIGPGRFQQRLRLAVAERRGFAFVRFEPGPFDLADRVVAYRVDLAAVVTESSSKAIPSRARSGVAQG